MEEKLKAPDSQSGDSEVRLFQRCQELQALVQEKEDVIGQLEQQLEEQVKHIHMKNFIKATDLVPVDVFFSPGAKECGGRCGMQLVFTDTKTHTNNTNSPRFGVTRFSYVCLLHTWLKSGCHALGMWTIILDEIALS